MLESRLGKGLIRLFTRRSFSEGGRFFRLRRLVKRSDISDEGGGVTSFYLKNVTHWKYCFIRSL